MKIRVVGEEDDDDEYEDEEDEFEDITETGRHM